MAITASGENAKFELAAAMVQPEEAKTGEEWNRVNDPLLNARGLILAARRFAHSTRV